MSSLIELNNLASIGTCITGPFYWISRDGLTISNNPSLTSLDGLGNINDTTIQYLKIQDCSKLSVCEVQSICTYLQKGETALISNNAPGCNNSTEVEDACDAVVGVHNIAADEVKIYPNPTHDIIYVEGLAPDSWTIRVINTLGAIVKHQKQIGGGQVDLSDLPNGLYFLEFQNEAFSLTKRVIKE